MRAAVWDHFSFTKLSDVKGEYEANCKYCNNTHYKNPSHVTTFDQRVFVRMFAEAIMYHSYPCSMVEHVKLREMLSLNPQVRHVTKNTILRYCWLEHLRLKSILHETLSPLNSRVCFTCDCLSACTTRGFLTLTAHFIDNNWSLKSRILNFRYFPPPHRGVDIYLFVVGLIKEWSLERKAFYITCDNAGAMDVIVARLKSDLLSFGTLPVAGRFFHVRCSAHILNMIVQSGIKVIDNNVLKLREAINYIAASGAHLCTFKKCVLDSKCNFRALEAKDALVLYAIVDTSFDFSLTSEQWTIVQFVCRFLGPFHSITELFSVSDYPTANLYVANVLVIEKLLVFVNNHEVDSIKNGFHHVGEVREVLGRLFYASCNSSRT
ncbi:putative AC transposase [Bienertia sinuspersici]